MRDILLTLIIAGLLPLAFKRPWIGAMLFAWLSIMNPHKLAYGFAFSFPWAQIVAVVTLLGFLGSSKERKPYPFSAVTTVYLLFMFWMTVTSLTALGSADWIRDRWIFVMKIHLMIFVTMMLVRGRKHIEMLLWVVVGSVAFYGVKGGLYTLYSGGRGRVWGPPGGMIEDNNALAVALVMMTPLALYVIYTCKRKLLRWGMWGGLVLMVLAALGTQSRGALLALLAAAALLGIKSKHPIRASLVIAVVMMVGIAFMPESWSSRMDTIQNYKADTSAMSRIYAWITYWNVAVDRPLVGAGFGTETLNIYRRYAPTEPPYDIFTGTVWAAHSIYLQVLGEHGFVGLFLFLTLWLLTWLMASRVTKLTRKDAEFSEWVPLLMRMCQVSLLAFAVGGTFLSLVHLDVTFYVLAIIVVTDATVRETLKARAKAAEVRVAPLSVAPPKPRPRTGAAQPAHRT